MTIDKTQSALFSKGCFAYNKCLLNNDSGILTRVPYSFLPAATVPEDEASEEWASEEGD
ncbi:MAG: hypothetical protein AAFS04_14645 [Cyanobacteria bacterium J06631_9]